MANLEDRIRELPPEQRREVEDFVEFLMQKRSQKRARPLGFRWAGALSDLKNRYTSAELQHEILSWRSGGE